MSEETSSTEKLQARLPYEDMSHLIDAGSLARMLARKGVISADEFKWLVIVPYLRPRVEAMTRENCMERKQELLDFLQREAPKPPPTNPPPPPVQKKGQKSAP